MEHPLQYLLTKNVEVFTKEAHYLSSTNFIITVDRLNFLRDLSVLKDDNKSDNPGLVPDKNGVIHCYVNAYADKIGYRDDGCESQLALELWEGISTEAALKIKIRPITDTEADILVKLDAAEDLRKI